MGVTGISAAPLVDSTQPNRVQMVITNRQDDNYGFGVITVENGNFATASINYPPLLLGAFNDYFDVNEAVAVTMTSDGKYAFVAGKNSRNLGRLIPSVDADSRAGSNIGIIKDPLTSNAKLVAGTLPIPDGWVNGLALSGDGKVLTAVYQGLGSGSIFAFDAEEIIKTVEHPELFVHSFLGESSYIFNDQTRPATITDLQYVPIDRINPAINQIGADFVRGNFSNGQVFGVPTDSKAPPILTGGNTFSVTAASDWLNLTPVSTTGYTEDLTPTLSWQIDSNRNVDKVDLFISTYGAGEGLLPWDELVDLNDSSFLPSFTYQQKQQLLTRDWNGLDDYNPGRTLTATWKRSTNQWTLADGTVVAAATGSDPANTMNTFTVPNSIILTAGGRLNWAVQATDTFGRSIVETAKFDTVAPLSTTPFSSVSILTQGFTKDPGATGIGEWVYTVGKSIINATGDTPDRQGLLLQFVKQTGTWLPVNEEGAVLQSFVDFSNDLSTSDPTYWNVLREYIKQNYLHKPLVLMNEWSWGKESVIPDSGFTEGAADDLFAAMVRLDQALGGGVGRIDPTTGQFRIYDENGKLIRTQGDIFNSPLHFIGHSRGTVVTSEIIQRLGTYFPYAGGAINADGSAVLGTDGKPVRDLQMTTLDPHDFDQPGLAPFADFKEPKIQIWDNVTFADNYYQTLGFDNSSTLTPNGRDIPNLPQAEIAKIANGFTPQTAGLNFPTDADGNRLGQPDFSFNMNNLTGFFLNPKNQLGDPHGEVVNWYAKTVDINLDEIGVDGRFTDQTGTGNPSKAIYDRLGEFDLASLIGLAGAVLPWFSSEGNGQGWSYSVLGGKVNRPPKKTRVPVSWDNTLQAGSRGDFAVPTLFNGNFDASFNNTSVFRNSAPVVGSTAVPGWSFRNNLASTSNWGNGAASTQRLVDWKDIPAFTQPKIIVDYQKDANGIPDKTKPIYESYLQRLNINPNASDYQSNYAIKLDSINNSITHNRFLVPDWGVLRFDAHVPDPDIASADLNGTLRVYLNGQELQSSAFQGVVGGKGKTGNEFPAVDLREFDDVNKQDPRKSESSSNRIGYGKQGFQTFQVDIPKEMRGKVATLEFKLEGGKTVYLDNISFKSQGLLFGNPILNGQQARKDIETPLFTPGDSTTNTLPYIPVIGNDPDSNFSDNYLIERPQYSLSYNKDLGTPNWVSYQLNKSWLGVENDSPGFQPDPKSPFGTTSNPKSTDIPDTSFYQKGHMTTASQRSRTVQDLFSTYLMSNVLPQPLNKGLGDQWTNLEEYLTRIVKNQNKELLTSCTNT